MSIKIRRPLNSAPRGRQLLSTPGNFCAAFLIVLNAQTCLAQTPPPDSSGANKANNVSVSAVEKPAWSTILKKAFQANISGRTDEAYSQYRAAVAAAEKDGDSKGIILCLGALADFLDSRDILPDQERLRKRALELSEKKFGPESPEYAQQLARLGAWEARSKAPGLGRSNIERAAAILGESDSKHPSQKASYYIARAHLLIAEGSLAAADECFKKGLSMQESSFSPAHPVALKTCREYAVLLDRLGRKAEADAMRQRVNNARLVQTGATAAADKGAFLKAVQSGKAADLAGQRAAGIAAWKQAVAEAEKRPDLDNELPFALLRLGDEYRSASRINDAQKLYRRSRRLREVAGNNNTLGMARNLERLALCANAQKSWAEAESLLKQALEIEQKVQASDQIVATTMESLLPACMANKDTKEAELIARQLLAISARQTGAAAANNKRMAAGVLGSIYIQSGRVDEGMKLMKEVSSTPADPDAYKNRKMQIEKAADQSEFK
jgi:hypothetical protein